MSEFFERQRQEAEQRRVSSKLDQQERENYTLRRRLDQLENVGEAYDDEALWCEIDALKEEIKKLDRRIQELEENQK